MENIAYLVERVNRNEEAIALLYDAAAKVGSIEALHDSIKTQQRTVEDYCQQERNRLAAIIREAGQKKDEKHLPFRIGGDEWYVYDGDIYRISFENDGNVTRLVNATETDRRKGIVHDN